MYKVGDTVMWHFSVLFSKVRAYNLAARWLNYAICVQCEVGRCGTKEKTEKASL